MKFFADVSQSDVVFFGIFLLLFFILVVIAFFVTAWMRRNAVGISPYAGTPLRRASDLPYESARAILQFVYDRHEYDNRLFDLKKAAFCRETGRVFPNCVSWMDTIDLDWSFLQKRYPGNYVSWGSLSAEQQTAIQEAHESLSGFQIFYSSSKSSPRFVEPEYAYAKPGPLYVDINTKVLLGWKIVPDTEFEVLIVQKPKNRNKI